MSNHYYKDAKTMVKVETRNYIREVYARERRFVNKLVATERLDAADADAEWRRLVREQLESDGLPIPEEVREP